MSEKYEIAIVGSGPAGLEAAINAKIRNKNIIIFGNKDFSPKLLRAPKINNYLGFYNISGSDLKNKFQEHIKHMGIEIIEERVNAIYAMGEYFSLMINDKIYEAKSVILATGIEYGKSLKGEEEFIGRGLGYCATCDAPLYKDKIVTIVGYNKEAEKDANYVSELASVVYYVPMNNEELDLNDKVKIIRDIPKEVVGNSKVTKLVLKNEEIETDGIFILKDSISPNQLVPGLEMEDDHIKVDKKMRTNIERCYAAGDCVGKPYQYIKSAGEGLIAALTAVEEL
ncbi:thioredoxin reductase [Clostridium botulinum]|uniref:Thioredoxin reductase n=1 Tax=Clostridium botulinum TaxID=1491 RepID=A0A9Q1UZM7_CLOBO|nr:NAD(P)/FAD-dependent oxidoreductase [Clostridium botulinum]KEI03659.1 thioredoxin reductase [Clostridium botulinum D str. 16868]KEI03871.1 thioredoxin reductase [Clostridium botulinum C/D str. Sp77]KLU77037.1 thioredoxin reductase [Clostridium botulinum V891]KOA74159.1 thioredoxin reductase [Clostridium botulinum]KOA78898.1 thioredoxin reductase [Clostridium botulinum]